MCFDVGVRSWKVNAKVALGQGGHGGSACEHTHLFDDVRDDCSPLKDARAGTLLLPCVLVHLGV